VLDHVHDNRRGKYPSRTAWQGVPAASY